MVLNLLVCLKLSSSKFISDNRYLIVGTPQKPHKRVNVHKSASMPGRHRNTLVYIFLHETSILQFRGKVFDLRSKSFRKLEKATHTLKYVKFAAPCE